MRTPSRTPLKRKKPNRAKRLAVSLPPTLGELIDLLDRRYLIDAEVEQVEGLRARRFRFGPPVDGLCVPRTKSEALKVERDTKRARKAIDAERRAAWRPELKRGRDGERR